MGLVLDLPSTRLITDNLNALFMNVTEYMSEGMGHNIYGIQQTVDDSVEYLYYAIICQIVTVLALLVGFAVGYILNRLMIRYSVTP